MLQLVALLPMALATPLAVASISEPAYGIWNLTYTRGGAASGFSWEYVNANYSGPPEVAVACKMLFDPFKNTTTRGCDDSSFSYAVTTEQGQKCELSCLPLEFRFGLTVTVVCVGKGSLCSRLCWLLSRRWPSRARAPLPSSAAWGRTHGPVKGLRRCRRRPPGRPHELAREAVWSGQELGGARLCGIGHNLLEFAVYKRSAPAPNLRSPKVPSRGIMTRCFSMPACQSHSFGLP